MTQEVPAGFSGVFNQTIAICQADENYINYSVREKMLALVFTFLQTLSKEENSSSAILRQNKIPWLRTANLASLKKEFSAYTEELLLEGTNSGEIQARPLVANYYQQVLWNAFVTVLYFWANDKSDHKENTDVMVEKTIHFAFDLLAPNAIDSGIDWIQNFIKLRNAAR